jgi:indole-3-glycerol phosphate synthase
MSNILETILATKRNEVRKARISVPLTHLRTAVRHLLPVRDFVGSLQKNILKQCPAVIAEVKKASPSKGVIRENFDPVAIACDYEAHGAACLSVLTDQHYFQGHLDDLIQIRQQVTLPLLRKDFIIDEYQITEARVAGADCILLIVAALELEQLRVLEQVAYGLGLAVLLEVHNEKELEQALTLKSPLIGINNRDLKTFKVNVDTTTRLLPYIPADRIVLTESGIVNPTDVAQMKEHNVHTFLVGEAFMRHPSPGQAMRQLFSISYPSFAL